MKLPREDTTLPRMTTMAKVSPGKKTSAKADHEWDRLQQEWADALRDRENEQASLVEGQAFYRAIEAIGVLYEKHESDWPDYLASHGIQVKPKKPFRALVKVMVGEAASPSWITKISATLDEWREHESAAGQEVPAEHHLAFWLHDCGGVKGVYEARRERLGVKPRVKRQPDPIKLFDDQFYGIEPTPEDDFEEYFSGGDSVAVVILRGNRQRVQCWGCYRLDPATLCRIIRQARQEHR